MHRVFCVNFLFIRKRYFKKNLFRVLVFLSENLNPIVEKVGNYFDGASSATVCASSFVSRLLYIMANPTITIKITERIAASPGILNSVLGIWMSQTSLT